MIKILSKRENIFQKYLTISSFSILIVFTSPSVSAGLPDAYLQTCNEINLLSERGQLSGIQRNFRRACNEIFNLYDADERKGDLVAALRHEEVAAQGSSTIESSKQQMLNITQRLHTLHKQTMGGAAGDENQSELLNDNRWGAFINGNLHEGERKKTVDVGSGTGTGLGSTGLAIVTGERAYEFNSKEVTLGTDYRLPGEKFILGAALGFNRQQGNLKTNAGKIDLNGQYISLYGTYIASDQAYVDGALSFGKNKIKASRLVPKAGSLTEFGRAFANPNSNQLSASLGGGYDIPKGQWTITPFTRLDYTDTSIDAYTETVDNDISKGMAVAVKKQNAQSLVGNLGLRVSSAMQTSKGLVIPQASIELAHEFKNDPRDIEARLLAADGLSGVSANPIARTSAPDRTVIKLGLGVSATFSKGQSGFLQVESLQGSKDFKDTALKFGYRMEF